MCEEVKARENPEKAGFFAPRSASMCRRVLKFHKNFSLLYSPSLIFRGLARGYPP
jgi:hypothetical protein